MQNAAGALAPTPGVVFMPAGLARSTTDLEITSFGFIERTIMGWTSPAVGLSTQISPNIYPVAEGRIRYTMTANAGANSGMFIEWSENGNVLDTWVPIGLS